MFEYPALGNGFPRRPAFWEILIRSQFSLQDIQIQFFGFPVTRVREWTVALIGANAGTLRRVHIGYEHYPQELGPENGQEHDGALFAACLHLKHLHFGVLSPLWLNLGLAPKMTNLGSLPASLVELDVGGLQVGQGDWNWEEVRKFRSLRRLQIRWLMLWEEWRLAELLRAIFRLRSLDFLSLNFEILGSVEPKGCLKDMMEALSEDPSVRNVSYHWLFIGRRLEYLRPWPDPDQSHREDITALHERTPAPPDYDYRPEFDDVKVSEISVEVNLPKYFPIMLASPFHYNSNKA
jgi:hypothetical protein